VQLADTVRLDGQSVVCEKSAAFAPIIVAPLNATALEPAFVTVTLSGDEAFATTVAANVSDEGDSESDNVVDPVKLTEKLDGAEVNVG
jgi:hypothetical protein